MDAQTICFAAGPFMDLYNLALLATIMGLFWSIRARGAPCECDRCKGPPPPSRLSGGGPAFFNPL